MAKNSTVTLKSSDDEFFEIIDSVACKSEHIREMVEDMDTTDAIPLYNVSGKILSKVLKYCEYHVDAENPADENSALTDDEIKAWDQEFVKVDHATLFDLIMVFSLKPSFN